MGFLDKIFGKKEVKKETVVLEVEGLKGFVEEKSSGKEKGLEKVVFSKLAEVKHLLNEVNVQLEKLKNKEVSLDEGNLRLRKAVISSRERLITQLNALIKKLEPPKTSDLHELMQYSFASSVSLAKAIVSVRKSIFYAKTILDQEIKELGKLFNELEGTFSELKKVFKESSLKEIQSLKNNVQTLNTHFVEKNVLLESLNDKKSELKNFENKKELFLTQVDELKNSQEMAELRNWETEKNVLIEKKGVLKNRVVSLIGEAEKPLHRFYKLADSKKYIIPAQEKDLLNQYLENVFFAIKKDPKGVQLKKILIEVEKLVLDSTIVLKEKEKEKKLLAIQKLIEFDFFNEIFWKLNSIDSEINSLEKKIRNFYLTKKISLLQQEINSIDGEILEKNGLIKNFSVKNKEQEDRIFSLKESIESGFNDFFQEKIRIEI